MCPVTLSQYFEALAPDYAKQSGSVSQGSDPPTNAFGLVDQLNLSQVHVQPRICNEVLKCNDAQYILSPKNILHHKVICVY